MHLPHLCLEGQCLIVRVMLILLVFAALKEINWIKTVRKKECRQIIMDKHKQMLISKILVA
jgi:hypothetical protein